jgi:hypothetical protein
MLSRSGAAAVCVGPAWATSTMRRRRKEKIEEEEREDSTK